MRRVAVATLEKNVAEYVRAAHAGETVLVTEDDRVVAELRPPAPERPDMTDDEFIAMGIREGWLKPARRHGPLPEPSYEPVMSFDELMADLAWSREDR